MAPAHPFDQYVWDIRYIDAPVVRFHDGDTDGSYNDPEDNTLYYCNDANYNPDGSGQAPRPWLMRTRALWPSATCTIPMGR